MTDTPTPIPMVRGEGRSYPLDRDTALRVVELLGLDTSDHIGTIGILLGPAEQGAVVSIKRLITEGEAHALVEQLEQHAPEESP